MPLFPFQRFARELSSPCQRTLAKFPEAIKTPQRFHEELRSVASPAPRLEGADGCDLLIDILNGGLKMGRLLEVVTPLHKATKRDYLARMNDDKVHCMVKAREYEFDYWDRDRRYGYGGYKFIEDR